MDTSLNGQWNVYYDEDMDLNEKDYVNGRKFIIDVPGAIEKILGNRIFSGPYFYEKEFHMDSIKKDKTYILKFSGVSYWCDIYINDKYVKTHEGVWESFLVDITGYIKAGSNKIMIKIFKPDFGKESKFHFRSVLFGFIPDIMIPFGGIWKDVTLLERGTSYFTEIGYIFDTDTRSIVIESKINNAISPEVQIEVTTPQNQTIVKTMQYSEKIVVMLDEIDVWSVNHPKLYTLKVTLIDNGISDYKEVKAGFRKVEIKGSEVYQNGEKVYLRGILHWGCYPEKFTPTPSYEEVKSELLKIKSLGFNMIKHCLYFPPSYYYELCDEMGIITWQELPLWLPYENGYLLDRINNQYPMMLKYFMHYPTVSLISLGCELDATISKETLNSLYSLIRERDKHMVICDNSGSGECYEGVVGSKSDIYDYHFYTELYYMENLINGFTRSYRDAKPWVFGEYNSMDTYRLADDIEKSLDYELWWLNPDEKKNLLRMSHKGFKSDTPVYRQKDILREYGIQEEVKDIKAISYKQAFMVRKFLLELTRSYKEIKGYNITALKDVPISTTGIFDDDMQSKFDPEQFNKINGDVVVSLTNDLSRIWDNGSDRFLNRDLYNYFSEDILKGRLVVSNRNNKALTGRYRVYLNGRDKNYFHFYFEDDFHVDKDDTREFVHLNIKLPEVEKAETFKLAVEIHFDGKVYKNEWDIWVYPNTFSGRQIYLFDNEDSFDGIFERFNVKKATVLNELEQLKEKDILVTTYFDKNIESLASKGVNILYYQKGDGYFPLTYNPFFGGGIMRIFSHYVTDHIAHLGYVGYQFYGVGIDKHYDKLELEKILGKYTPIIRRYDARQYQAGDYMLEYCKGKGKIIATTLNFEGGKGSQPYNFKYNIFANHLLNTIINYFG